MEVLEGEGWARRFGLRAAAVYSLLYVLPFPLGFPGTEAAAEAIQRVKGALVNVVAGGLKIQLVTDARNTSDSLASYLEIATLGVVALVIAGGLVALGRRGGADATWRAWWRVWLRYFVAASMASYGAVKVLKSQFPALQPSDLQTTYGESSPMGLLWRMMSLSTAYSVITGLVEVAGALLLLFRRTTLLGALVLATALVNVVALNFCFDVPVKIGSVHLLVFTLCLIAPDARRFAAFLGGRAVAAHAEAAAYAGARPKVTRALLGVKGLAVAVLVGSIGYQAWTAYRTWGDGAPAQPLWALYQVTDMQIDGAPADAERWYRVTIDRQGFIVFGTKGGRQGYEYEYDATARSVVVAGGADRLASAAGSTEPHPDALALEGTIGARHASIRMRRVRDEEIVLTSRGFHWVSNGSYHR